MSDLSMLNPVTQPQYMEMSSEVLNNLVRRLPKDIRTLLTENPNTLWVGGGWIRANIAGETISDIDLFGIGKSELRKVAENLLGKRAATTQRSRMFSTKNAITLLTEGRTPVQLITRWVFNETDEVLASFDFTICQAAIWWDGTNYRGRCAVRYFEDLAAKRLYYTEPVREEEAGGSMMRVLKFTKRGYNIQVLSLGRVMARVYDKMRSSQTASDDPGRVVAGILREVDPLTVIDGLDLADDPEVKEITDGTTAHSDLLD